MCKCAHLCVALCMYRCSQRPEEGVRTSGAGFTGDSEASMAPGSKLGPPQKLQVLCSVEHLSRSHRLHEEDFKRGSY